jgi:hypothetical protein
MGLANKRKNLKFQPIPGLSIQMFPGQVVNIGDDIRIQVTAVQSDRISFKVQAPKEKKIDGGWRIKE